MPPKKELIKRNLSQKLRKASNKKSRILNDRERHTLKMQGDYGKVLSIWESLRQKQEKSKRALIDEVLQIMEGRLVETARRPDICRVYQTCVKFGTPQQRSAFALAFQGHLVELSSAVYSYHLVVALLRHLSSLHRLPLLEELMVSIVSLLKTKFGQLVIDQAYTVATPLQRNQMLLHSFGRKDLVLESKYYSLTFEEILANCPQLRIPCLNTLGSLTDLAVNRGLVDSQLMHQLLDLQFRVGYYSTSKDLLPDLKGPLVHICHTHYGTQLAIACLSVAEPADRKEIVTSFQKSIAPMALGKHSSILLCRLLDLFDDTAFLQKHVLGEVVESLEDFLTDDVASRLLLHLLTPQLATKQKYIPDPFAQMLSHEGGDLNELVLNDLYSNQHGNASSKEVTTPVPLFEQPWPAKHAAALQHLLPHVCSFLERDLKASAQHPICRKIITELVNYSQDHQDALDPAFASKLKNILNTTEDPTKVAAADLKAAAIHKPQPKPQPKLQPIPQPKPQPIPQPKQAKAQEAKQPTKKLKKKAQTADQGEASQPSANPPKKRKLSSKSK
eukprot:NODE_899_length_1775_cov_28.210558_g843_i0.p1 GENE.NODE_899_length_1775_cov_28.210558_g843_i0~~NODE_899_length_1775_cov_28.210558_g843_i0.p1  ORF type:complete len:578 (+),score=182.69 NODE_899_length_1775_cov_28.210558_g843_i0:60-1736(+)